MAAGDATLVPIKGKAYRLYFPWWKNDGTLISGATVTSTQIAKDGGTFNTVSPGTITELASSGIYYIEFSATEMQADCVFFKAVSSTTGACVVAIPVLTQSSGNARIPVDLQTIGSTDVATYSPVAAAVANFARGASAIIIGQVDTATFTATATVFETNLVGSPYSTANALIGRWITFTSGSLINQSLQITAYTYATNTKGKITVAGFTGAPSNTDQFVISG